MGTNYYWYSTEPCPTCHRRDEPLHIGKSSCGWAFSLRIHPDQGINTLDDWRLKWAAGEIRNEYDEVVSVSEMLNTITNRSHPRGLSYGSDIQDRSGRNSRKGEGTFDYCDYEFS